MDDLAFFDLEGETLTASQLAFLAALRSRLNDRLRPYCGELTEDSLLLVLDVDAPDTALVSVGLELRRGRLQGDRISVHDRSFPTSPTVDGFLMEGAPDELAATGAALLERFANRPIVRHEWLHRGKVYADCYLFEDSGERLSQMYRGDWAPRGQERRLITEGFVHGKGWVQTRGLGEPDRVVHVRGER
ncbi:hypothetical protein FHP29_15730 [Nocardioides albidus]|uniref:Uncharacterized protein n=1 Tax=Nocardioides albidus TaxID=1517589 RepID=A0A5C4VN19_9ACTN|nr:hypothetical protein [Nocardioides albidus]TNM37294.1 hypothetical protein FHP29_15730 [Nocardioides albidus]